MQNLESFEAMAAVTPQFLQSNAQYQAGETDAQQLKRFSRVGNRCPEKKKAKATKARRNRPREPIDSRQVASRVDVWAT